MKKITFVILTLNLCLLTNLFSQPTDYIGYWPFNGNANDESGNGNHGTVNGATLTTDRFNNENSAYYFDGSNDYIEIPDFNTVSSGATTVMFWFKPENCVAISHYSNIVVKRNEWGVGVDNCNYEAFTWGDNIDSELGGHSFTTGTWYHVAMIYDQVNGNLSIYENGSLIAEDTSYTDLSTDDTYPILINGDDNTVSAGAFIGSIDDVTIYDRALDINELVGNSSLPSSSWQENSNNIYYEGRVSIGTQNAIDGYNLSVRGKIVTDEVKVTLDGWSDFVFEPEYQIMPISELEDFIEKNHHLPSIPSETEVKENGINIGEMNAKLLQKIEELTLYIIEQNREIEKLKERLEKNGIE